MIDGASTTVSDAVPATTGAVTVTCSNGTLNQSGASCAINGVCSGTSNTCTAGSPSGYAAGSCGGSQTWTCNGSGGGSNASCSIANAACALPSIGISTLSAGSTHTCGLKADGTAWCWGNDPWGRLGNGGSGNSTVPRRVGTAGTSTLWSDWVSITAGGGNSCGIRSNGEAYCWGFSNSRTTPFLVPGGNSWKSVWGGSGSQNCGLKTDGTAWCWGNGSNGRLGNGGTGSSSTPVRVGTAGTSTLWSDWVLVGAGNLTSCGIRADGTAWCWGAQSDGAIGNNTTGGGNRVVPTAVGTAGTGTLWSDWIDIAVKGAGACGRRANKSVWCWGGLPGSSNGDGTFSGRLVPVAIAGGGTWDRIGGGGETSCGIKTDGSLWCWGGGGQGQIGNGANSSVSSPTRVGTAGTSTLWSDWISVYPGGFSNPSQVCGVRSNSLVYCWGGGASGMRGDGTTANRNYPVPVSDAGPWAQ